MRRTTLAEWLVVGALAALFLLGGAAVASAQTGFSGTNVANGSSGISGPATGGNVGSALGGPVSAGFGGVAATQMDGDTSTVVDQNTVGASAPAIAGSQVSKPGAGTKTQNTNVSTGALAVSGPATAVSVVGAQSGPSAVAGPGSAAFASQTGDANTVVDQDTVAVSGPAIAGSQVVTGGIGDALTQGVNVSTGALSLSGPATAFNLLGAATGPSSVAALGGIAVTGQVGDDDAFLTQAVASLSGAAISGSQTTQNPVGRVQDFNSSTGAASASGPATAGNTLASVAGPTALALGLGTVSSSTHGGNAAVLGTQTNGAASGNAVTGSQVYGLSAAELAVLDIPNQQASDPDFMQPIVSDIPLPSAQDATAPASDGSTPEDGFDPATGTDPAAQQPQANDPLSALRQLWDTVVNWPNQVANLIAGFLSGGLLGQVPSIPGGTGPANPSTTVTTPQGNLQGNQTGTQQGSQTGNNQGVNVGGTGTGNGVQTPNTVPSGTSTPSGSSIPGLPSGTSIPSGSGTSGVPAAFDILGSKVQNTNLAAGNVGFTGAATSLNAGLATAGPSSVAASIGVPSPIPGLGRTVATAGQAGDAFTTLDQDTLSVSGDSRAGSQVAGPGSRTHDFNVAVGNIAGSGSSLAVNAGAAQSGPQADALRLALVPALGDTVASAGQFGDANGTLDQGVISASGDATSASQVSGLGSAGLGAGSLNVNIGALGAAFSGNANGVNAGAVTAGPQAQGTSLALGPNVLTGNAVASANQFGDDDALLAQRILSTSGDATTGSQTSNGLFGGLTSIGNFNLSVLGLSVTGSSNGLNVADESAGPKAGASSLGAGALSASQQWGDDSNQGLQRARASSGEATAGSQDLNALGAGALLSHDKNVSLAAVATSGEAVSANFGSTVAGPAAAAFAGAATGAGPVLVPAAIAVAGQTGNDTSRWGQLSRSFSGDSLAGSQGNAVTGGQLSGLNVAVGSLSVSGAARAADVLGNVTGPVAAALAPAPGPAGLGTAAAFVGQNGNDFYIGNQHGDALSGDVIAGSQIRTPGLTGSAGNTNNIAFGSAALSGEVDVLNAEGSTAGPTSLAVSPGVPAVAVSAHDGDGILVSDQKAVGVSGDGAAGSQIDGTALFGLLFGTNVTAGSLALTGPVIGGNIGIGIAGPPAISFGGVSLAGQHGTAFGAVLQRFGFRSGDVLAGTNAAGLGAIGFLLFGQAASPVNPSDLLGLLLGGSILVPHGNALS